MGVSDLDPEKQKKYDELKKLYQKKPKIEIPEKQLQSEPHDDIINSLQKQLEGKQVKLNNIHSKELFNDLKEKRNVFFACLWFSSKTTGKQSKITLIGAKKQ